MARSHIELMYGVSREPSNRHCHLARRPRLSARWIRMRNLGDDDGIGKIFVYYHSGFAHFETGLQFSAALFRID
jgi:hypothetical protein